MIPWFTIPDHPSLSTIINHQFPKWHGPLRLTTEIKKHQLLHKVEPSHWSKTTNKQRGKVRKANLVCRGMPGKRQIVRMWLYIFAAVAVSVDLVAGFVCFHCFIFVALLCLFFPLFFPQLICCCYHCYRYSKAVQLAKVQTLNWQPFKCAHVPILFRELVANNSCCLYRCSALCEFFTRRPFCGSVLSIFHTCWNSATMDPLQIRDCVSTRAF